MIWLNINLQLVYLYFRAHDMSSIINFRPFIWLNIQDIVGNLLHWHMKDTKNTISTTEINTDLYDWVRSLTHVLIQLSKYLGLELAPNIQSRL